METFKENEQCVEIILTPQDVESAIRQYICTCQTPYSKDWLLNPKYNLGSIVFVGTKK